MAAKRQGLMIPAVAQQPVPVGGRRARLPGPPLAAGDHEVMRRRPQHYRNGELVIVIDGFDLSRSAQFWARVLGYTAGAPASGPYRRLVPEGGKGIEVLLGQVPGISTGRIGCTWTCAPMTLTRRSAGSSISAHLRSPAGP
jgi:hypothetical protein